MAVVAQSGVLGFGPQAGKETAAETLYKHRAADIDLAVLSDDRLGPPEVGGTPTPTIPYRAGVMAAGGATIHPRLEDTFGWLLQGVAGDVTSTTDEDVFETTATDFNHHTFAFDTTSEGYIPWMTFYKHIPGATADEDLAEKYVDCKIVNMDLVLPNDGLIQSRVDVIGRMASGAQFDDPIASTEYGNTEFEDYESIPIGSVENSYIQVPNYAAEDLPIVAATISLSNMPLDVRQEKIFGSPYLQDVTIVSRQLTVDMIVKWEDPDLYRSILTGSTTATQWTASPFVEDLDIYALSYANAIDTYPWQIRVQAPKVMYRLAGGIRLAGNDAVMMRIQGTAIKGTEYYYKVHLGNTVTSYSWPS